MLQCRRLRTRIGEAHVLEAHAILGMRPARLRARGHGDVGLQVLVQRGQVQVVLVHAADRGQHRRHGRLALAEQGHVHRHLPQRDEPAHGGDGDPGIGAVKRTGADEAETEAPRIATDGQFAVLLVEAPEDVAIALEQALTQAEQLDLLGVVLARQHGLQIDLHARLGRAPAEQAKCVPGELRFGNERRQSRYQQHRDRPGREVREQRAVAHQRDAVLHQAEGAHHQAQGPRGGLAARARELVVELRVLEVLQLQRQRLLEDHHVHALSELGAQQRLAQRQAALRGRDADDQHAFEHARARRRGATAAAAAHAATTASTISEPT